MMKFNIKITTILVTAIIFSACSNDIDNVNSSDVKELETPDIVLQEADPNAPKVVNREFTRSNMLKSGSGVIGNTDVLLGRGYKVGNSIMGDYPNFAPPVVDIKKVKAFDPEYIIGSQLFGNETYQCAYSTLERYEYNSTVTKKKSSGLSIGIAKVFSFGRKKTTTEVFSSTVNNSTATVYGELSIDIRNSLFTLQGSTGARSVYARSCLSSTFVRNLYSGTMSNIQDEYGHFVVGGYYTGGKAFALYAGQSVDNLSAEKKETSMSKDISASFTYKTATGDGSLSIGKGNNTSTTNIYQNTAIEIYVKTLGGVREEQGMTSAAKLDGLSIDLTPWLKSLKDINTHTIIDIADGGLYPISAFILEENFKRRLDDNSDGFLQERPEVITPHIEILPVYVRSSSTTGEPLYEVAAVLNTRQGDKIVLSEGLPSNYSDDDLKANNNTTTFNQRALEIFNKKKIYFVGMKITSNTSRKLNPSIRNPYVCIRLSDFKETGLYRFKNPDTGIEYIYNTSNRTALSYFIDKGDDDWILDDYRIRDWVEDIPTKKISMTTLSNSYKIIGL